MILVIRHTQEITKYDACGNVIAKAGEVYVSHGVDLNTGKGIPIPWEKWSNFAHNCYNYKGEWYLI